MPRPLLPPRGVFTPTKLIYHPQLPPAVLLTWIQLRGLAWGGQVTPPIKMSELATITGRSPATLYRHLTQLRSRSGLSWRTVGQAGIILSFTEKPLISTQDPQSPASILDSQNRDPGVPYSPVSDFQNREPGVLYSPGLDALNRDSGVLYSPDVDSQKREPGVPCSPDPILKIENQGRSTPLIPILKIVDSPSLNPLNNSSMIPVFKKDLKDSQSIKVNFWKVEGEGECEGGRNFAILEQRAESTVTDLPAAGQPQLTTQTPTAEAGLDPVSTYRFLVHLTPTRTQRLILAERITDLPLWQQTVEHWLMHAWNPRNLTGMLDLYQRGGAAGCRYCRGSGSPHEGARLPLDHRLAAIEAVRRKQAA